MGLNQAIDITAEQRKIILALLGKYLPNTTAWVYGSRVKWTSRPQSDLDMAVLATPEQTRKVSDLREAFEESNLPFRVDLFVWNDVPEAFKKQIEAEHVVLVEREDREVTGEWQETVYGRFSSDFVEDCLADLCDPVNGVQTGPFGSQLHKQDYVSVGTPIITVEHLGDNRILHQGLPRVSDHDRERLSKYILRDGDIVFSRVGSVDRRALVNEAEEGWLFSGRCLRVRPNPKKIDSGYLSYFFGLPSFKEHIRAIAVGATMPSLNTQILSDILIPHPRSLDEQRAIGHILGTLDDKIELNPAHERDAGGDGASAVQVLVRRFRPRPRQDGGPLAAGKVASWAPRQVLRPLPRPAGGFGVGRDPGGMGGEGTREMFQLDDGTVSPGAAPTTTMGEGLPFFQGRTDFSFRYPGNRKFCTAPTRVAQAGDTLVSVRAPVGDINMAWDQCCVGRGVAALRHKSGSSSFTYYATWTFQPALQEYEHTGTVFGAINKNQFETLRMVEPDRGVVSAFDSCVRPLDKRILSNEHESHTLVSQRDVLLPRLVSGTVRIKGAIISSNTPEI